MSTPLRIAQLFATPDAVVGTPSAVGATDAVKLSREGTLPERVSQPINRQLVHDRADYGGAARQAAQYWQGSLPPIYLAYPATAGVLDGDGPLKHEQWFTGAGYRKQVIAAGGGNAGANRFYVAQDANVASAGLAASCLRFYATDSESSGKIYQVDSARWQGDFEFGAEMPHRFTPRYMGGYNEPEASDVQSATYNYDPLVVQPLSCLLSYTSLRDGALEEIIAGIVLASAKITSPYAPTPNADFAPNGYTHPCYMAAGQVAVELVLQVKRENIIPVEYLLREIEHVRLRLALTYDDTGGDGGVLRHVVRGLMLTANPTLQNGPPMTWTLSMMGSASEDGSLVSHEFEFAEEVADLSTLSDEPTP